MESISVILKVFDQLFTERIDEHDRWIVQTLHDSYVRPLQESVVLKKVDVAKRLQISPSTVTQLIDTGRLETTADGRVTEYNLWQYLIVAP